MKRTIQLLLFILLVPATGAHANIPPSSPKHHEAKNYRLHTIAVVRNAPGGEIADIWNKGIPFTSTVTDGEWVRITGHFPDNNWQKVEGELWISSHYVKTFTPRVVAQKKTSRPEGVLRYIQVDKSNFTLKVIEQNGEAEQVLFSTQVALGMDRCLPKEKGGRCYYTEPGEYSVRWKVHDPEGIEWCIPKFMEKEYSRDVANGNRCFRGPLGKFALNIGKSYAIHGTNKPSSLGKRVSHGCVRTANNDMQRIYQMMEVGDRVVIVN